jgi:SSS family solute:Na+ symporter
LGGDFYTAYTVIAVPALVFAVGGYGFFALPYTIIVYPIVFIIMPKLWAVAHKRGHVTAADVVHERYGSRSLELAVALTGVLATMPYIALQLVGMEAVIKALGLAGELPLIGAFLILALYTYSSGLRAPALIAFVKDTMIYIVVLVAIVYIPWALGGFGVVFEAADKGLSARGGVSNLLLPPGRELPYATLALGSALAAFMYPHMLTGIFAAKSAGPIRKNAVLLLAYTLLLGLIALLGYMVYAAGLKLGAPNDAVPSLFKTLFPSWFAGFAFAAIAVGALVPAAVMSIGAATHLRCSWAGPLGFLEAHIWRGTMGLFPFTRWSSGETNTPSMSGFSLLPPTSQPPRLRTCFWPQPFRCARPGRRPQATAA